MTFILNILRDDFSMLFADKRATSNGPSTLRVGQTTIHIEGKLEVSGYQKLTRSSDRYFAVGIAGTTMSHPYVSDIEKESDQGVCVQSILRAMTTTIATGDRDPLAASSVFREHSGVATLYDAKNAIYCSLCYGFSTASVGAQWYRRNAAKPLLIHTGSGSTHFHETVGIDKIHAFVDTLKSGAPPAAYLPWIREAYRKVSETDKAVSADFNGLISYRGTAFDWIDT